MEEQAGKHSYDGEFKPRKAGYLFNPQTFSVGCFEWIPRADGKGLKRGRVKFRVRGKVSEAEEVYACAEKICEALDAGVWFPIKSCRAGSDWAEFIKNDKNAL